MKSDSRDPSHCGHDEENANNLSRWFGIDGIERHDFDYVGAGPISWINREGRAFHGLDHSPF